MGAHSIDDLEKEAYREQMRMIRAGAHRCNVCDEFKLDATDISDGEHGEANYVCEWCLVGKHEHE